MPANILKWPRPVKRAVVMLLDVTLSLLASWLAFTLRLDTAHVPEGAQWIVYAVCPALSLPIFHKLGLYEAIFRYSGMGVLLSTSRAITLYAVVLFGFLLLAQTAGLQGLPRTIAVLQPLIFGVLVVASRSVAHMLLTQPRGRAAKPRTALLIYGAGSAGVQTAEAIASTRQYRLVGFVDDDVSKAGQSINAVRVYPPKAIPRLIEQYGVTEILLALPSVSRSRRNHIIEGLCKLPVHIRTLPGLADLASGRVQIQDIRELEVDDLLTRPPVQPHPALMERNCLGKTVLVTGAGGSIGSELCRQVLGARPLQLILVDNNEFALYSIHQELAALVAAIAPHCELVPQLANVRDLPRAAQLCNLWRPHIVYHAAAYKHVPLVESNVVEGVRNNVFGTINMARASMAAGVACFVLVSTDKAVRPTSVMGATKRIAELALQALAAASQHQFPDWLGPSETLRHQTRFAMVRFGNVLGSSGSVVPLFRRQIAAGGPVTVTHPEVTRYFMTIPEAAQLIMQAGALATGGEVFVLDMGQAVKITDLAHRMVRLSGYTVRDAENEEGDIEIVFTGLRPGEKLFEELLLGEDPQPTAHPRIIQAREEFLEWPDLVGNLQDLAHALDQDDVKRTYSCLAKLVPGACLTPPASGPVLTRANARSVPEDALVESSA